MQEVIEAGTVSASGPFELTQDSKDQLIEVRRRATQQYAAARRDKVVVTAALRRPLSLWGVNGEGESVQLELGTGTKVTFFQPAFMEQKRPAKEDSSRPVFRRPTETSRCAPAPRAGEKALKLCSFMVDGNEWNIGTHGVCTPAHHDTSTLRGKRVCVRYPVRA